MKNFRINFYLLLLISLTFSCSNKTYNDEEQEGNIVGLSPSEIVPLSSSLLNYTETITSKFKLAEFIPDVDNSTMALYEESPIQAIFTPLIPVHETSSEVFHVYYSLDGLVSAFEFLLTEEYLNENTMRYSYSTVEGETYATFDVSLIDGRIFNIQLDNYKGFADRWENCVTWTLSRMNMYDTLACMAFGPYCAAGIATLCAIGAAENQFLTPDGP